MTHAAADSISSFSTLGSDLSSFAFFFFKSFQLSPIIIKSLLFAAWMLAPGNWRTVRETRIYSVLSFPRRRESSQIKHLDPHLLGDNELICVSLGIDRL